MSIQAMLTAHPRGAALDANVLAQCIEDCFECAKTCTACADACLGENEMEQLARCIRLNLDCADVCETTGRILSRQTEPEWSIVRTQIEACLAACRACGDECERHADEHDHCMTCMQSCRRCEESCKKVLADVGSTAQA